MPRRYPHRGKIAAEGELVSLKGHRVRVRRTASALGFAFVVLSVAAPAGAQDPPPVPRPSPIDANGLDQPLQDGCQRNPVGLLTFTSPEWALVYSHEDFNPDPKRARVMEGIADFADVAGGDLPEGHNFYDFNIDVALDPDYQYLADTGSSHLHVEWESGTLPYYAWATAGDRLKNWGTWIWDCGHWGPGFAFDPDDPAGTIGDDTDYFLPGTGPNSPVTGEGTEFHPMQAVLVTRQNPYLPQVGETETDAFMSSDGTPARANSTCAHDNQPPELPEPIPPAAYPPSWTACAQNPLNEWQPVNDRDYTFFVPVPPKPTPNANLRFRIQGHDAPGNGPDEQYLVRNDGVEVTVPFRDFGSQGEALAFARSFFVGWTGLIQYRPAHLQVDLNSVTVHDSLDSPAFGTSTGVPPGEYGMYLDVNGNWSYVNDLAPGLDHVFDETTLEVGKTLDIYVPAGQPVDLLMDTRECDLPKIAPCAATPEAAEDNDAPGSGHDTFGSAEEAVGDHTMISESGAWEMSYTVRQLSAATLGPPTPGSDCFDTLPPRSKIRRKGIHPRRHRLGLKGRATDRLCFGPGHVADVEVAVAKQAGKGRCRFLQPDGEFAEPQTCEQKSFLPTQGAKRWHFRSPWHGNPGRYIVFSQALDDVGNVETKQSGRNRARFRIRS
jgi:hypothetical protein